MRGMTWSLFQRQTRSMARGMPNRQTQFAQGNQPSPGVGALWARSRIEALLTRLREGEDEAVIRPAVVETALAHHLVSRFTSWGSRQDTGKHRRWLAPTGTRCPA